MRADAHEPVLVLNAACREFVEGAVKARSN